MENLRLLRARLNIAKGDRLDDEVTSPEFVDFVFGPATFEQVTYRRVRTEHGWR